MAGALIEVPGIVAVALGGSRARGSDLPDSDVDLGLYYRSPFDLVRLRAVAEQLATGRHGSESPTLTEPGEWGPWVDGGGWLDIDGLPVDWLYRDLDRVHRSWESAAAGRFSFHFQVGHPLGVPDFAYAGEVALGIVLADPSGEVRRLQDQARDYPAPLARAILDRLAEADFLLDVISKSCRRGDAAYVSGCLFRVVGLCAHAIHARASRWVINEKGLVAGAGTLPAAPPDFARRAHAVLGELGTEPDALLAAVAAAATLVAEVRQSGSP